MHGEQRPAPQERVSQTFTVDSHALRLVIEVDLTSTDTPTHEEAANIIIDAMGAATLEDVQGQVQHIDYRAGERRPKDVLGLPFPDDNRPVELPTSEELSPREQGMVKRFGLTVREIQVLRLVAHGQTNSSIGRTLFISAQTVKTYMRGIFGKISASDRANAVAIVNNIVPQPPKKLEVPRRPKRKKGKNSDI
jgi:DNA-binding CsgD family transcriptional regulator